MIGVVRPSSFLVSSHSSCRVPNDKELRKDEEGSCARPSFESPVVPREDEEPAQVNLPRSSARRSRSGSAGG